MVFLSESVSDWVLCFTSMGLAVYYITEGGAWVISNFRTIADGGGGIFFNFLTLTDEGGWVGVGKN